MSSSKQALRQQLRQQRAAMAPEDIRSRSLVLCRMAAETKAYQKARSLYGYLPFNQEVDTLPLLRQALADGKTVALPKCYGRLMRFIAVTDLSRVQHNGFGVPEPVDDAPVADDPAALVLMPGLAFDRDGNRLGYGGGYYDRFLAGEPEHPTIALCFDFQLLPRLTADPHDIPVQTILSV